MRFARSLAPLTLLFLLGCPPAEVSKKDMLRDARVGCEKGNGAACFHAGALYGEVGDGQHARESHRKGCSLHETASCDALAAIDGPAKEGILAEACSGGDLVSCARLSDLYPAEGPTAAKRKSLLEDVCKASSAMTPQTPARDLQGAASGCVRLAATYAKTDGALAGKLDTLAALLFTEALFRLEKQEDAAVDHEIAARPMTATDKDRVDRVDEADKHAHDELLAALDAKAKLAPGTDAPRVSPLTVEEEVFGATVASVPKAAGAPVDDAAQCRDTGDPTSCAIAGAARAQTDPAAAMQLHVAACTKRPDQCWSLIALADSTLRKHDGARATQILTQGCDLKSGNACLRLAIEYDQGERGIAQDLGKAAKLYDKACEYGNARGCLGLATLAEDGRGTGRNPGRAKQLRTKSDAIETARKPLPAAGAASDAAGDEQACRQARAADKCLSAAQASQDTDAVKAEELHRIGCTANKATCGLWTFAIDRLRRDDTSRGTRLLEQGCVEGSPIACTALAEVQHLGYRTVPRAEARAAELYQKGCDVGSAFACRVTASRFRAVKNPQHADELRDLGQKAEDADKLHGDADSWAKDATERRQHGNLGGAHDLGHILSEWKALVERARMRADARTKKLESAYAGRRAPPVPELTKDETDASAAREATIHRSVSTLFKK